MTHALVEKYYQEFYRDGKALESHAMSSFWRPYTKKFKATRSSGELKISGAGFGAGQQKPRLPGRLLGWLEIILKILLVLPDGRKWPSILRARSLVGRMGLYFGPDAFRQLCVLNLLEKNLPFQPKRILVIGDGPGFLSAFLHGLWPQTVITLVDLGATLTIQAQNLTRAFPKTIHRESFQNKSGFEYIPAERFNPPLEVRFDLAVNVASMQEMSHKAIKEYFLILRKHRCRFFYCCNRQQKELPDGEIIKFESFPWQGSDQVLVGGMPNWANWFLGAGGRRFPGLAGFVPLLRRFDGPILHRFVRFSSGTR